MLVEIKLQSYVNSRGSSRVRNSYRYNCDQCKNEFETTQKIKGNQDRLHFCSKICVSSARKKLGALCKKQEQTNVEKYGHERPMQNLDVESKRRKTSLERYGTEIPTQSNDVKLRCISNMHETFKKRYGVSHPLQVKDIRFRAHKKAHETFAKYGVKSPAQMPGAREKIKRTCTIRYGVDNPMKSSIINKKALKTKEARGINLYKSTLIEKRLLKIFNEIFPSDEIAHPKWFEQHPVDFFIPSINTWIEHDGDFWHGLTEKSKLYSWTQERFRKDRKQDARFAELNMNLVRIRYSNIQNLDDQQLEIYVRMLLNVS